MLTTLRTLATDWGSVYSNHAVLRTAVTFAHVGGLVVAAGAAIVADRAILTAFKRDDAERRSLLASVQSYHAMVLTGLLFVLASGVLLFAADVDTYLSSRLFWIKMGLSVLLMVNGAVLMRAERHTRASDHRNSGRILRWTALASLTLWSATTLLGTGLLNIG
jgi:uncharacterized membrane protein